MPTKKHTKKVDKKKVLPKKFPELKMMINGDQRNSNHTLSSDDDMFNFPPIKKLSGQSDGTHSQNHMMHQNSFQKNKI